MKTILLLWTVITLNFMTASAQQCVWAKGSVCSDYIASQYATVSDAAGDVYSMGLYDDTINFGGATLIAPGSLEANTFVVKYNSAGMLLWAKQYGDTMSTVATSMAIDGAGNLYLFGNFDGTSVTFGATTLTNHGGLDFFLVKLDGSGNVMWAKDMPSSYHSASDNSAAGVSVAPGGYVVVTGTFDSTVTFGSTVLTSRSYFFSTNMFVAKYDTAGNVIWATGTVSGIPQLSNVMPGGIATDASGNIYVTGAYLADSISFGSGVSASPGGMFLVKYSVAGSALWALSAGNDTCSIAATTPVTDGTRVATDAVGNVYVLGAFDCTTMNFGSTTLTNSAPGEPYLFLAKYDGTGAVVWAKGAGGNNANAPTAILVSSSGNIYVGGFTLCDTLKFGGGVSVSAFAGGMFLAKYDNAGTAIWARGTTGLNGAELDGIALGPGNAVYAAGTYATATVTFDTCVLYDATSPNVSVYVAKFDDETAGVAQQNEAPHDVRLYPNPAHTQITIEVSPGLAKGEVISSITISDLLGQTVRESSTQHPASSAQIDVSSLPPGMYLVRINGTEVRKFMKE